jgi:DNA-binding NarL/FixJ family response regulator
MGSTRILVVSPKAGDRCRLPPPAQISEPPSLFSEAASTVNDAIVKLSQSGFDAVVCWAEGQDELAGIIRIRKSQPGLPILLLTPQSDDGFHTLARTLGASLILRAEGDAARTAALIRTAIASGHLATEHLSRASEARCRVQDLRRLIQENRSLAAVARTQLRSSERLTFIPLVVEGDADAASRILRALQEADVFSPLPILNSRDQAVRYLDGLLLPGARGTRVMPSVLILDADLANDGAIGIVKHVRSLYPFAGLPVILLGSTADRVRVARAYEAGANSWIERTSEHDALVQCLSSLKSYWGSFNQGPGLY